MNYITEKIVDDPESTLTIQDIYSEFKEWYKSSYSTLYNMPSKTELKEYMEKYYKNRFRVNRVIGIRYHTEEDDEILVMLSPEK